jgi:TP901 family phage tail tape measure protein
VADFYITGDADLTAARRKLEDFAKYVESSFKPRIEKSLKIDVNVNANKSIDSVKKATDGASKSVDELAQRSLPRVRYALYDVSATAGMVSAALLGITVAAAKTAADFESSFTQIERTTMSSIEMLDSLKRQLITLSREVPVAFGDLANIASLGAQLGIASGDLAGFTKTVSEFAATTNVSAETSAQSFGALGQLLDVNASQYQNLGSAIAQVGVNSIATESEILSVSTQIAGVAASAGLSADYVVGLSGALASLRIPAEQSRGALTRVFQEINRAAATGGKDLQNFANVLGVSTGEAKKLASTDMETFFSKFITGLSGLNNSQLTTTLDNLNLSELRVTNTLTRLSRNTDLLAQTQGDASQAYKDGTFLAAAYALKVEDIASKFQILQNGVQEFAAKAGDALTPVLGPIIDGVTNIVNAFSTALSVDSGKWFAGITLGALGLVGGLTALISVGALAVASLFALQTAISGLQWTAAMGGARGLAAALWGDATAAAGATTGVKFFSAALKTIPLVAIAAGIIALGTAFYEAGRSADVAFDKFVGSTSGLADALAADTDAWKNSSAEAQASATTIEYAATSIGSKYGDAAQKVGYVAQVLGKDVPSSAYAASSAVEYNTRVIGDNTMAWLENTLMQSKAFQELAGNASFANFVKKTGYDVAEAFRIQAAEGEDAAAAYYYRMAKAAVDSGQITLDEIQAVDYDLAVSLSNGNDAVANADASGGATWANTFLSGLLDVLGPFGDWYVEFIKFITNGQVNLASTGKDLSNSLKGAVSQISILDINSKNSKKSTEDLASSLDGLGNSAQKAAAKVYLLTDYANDLSSIWKRAFDIRFSGEAALDNINSKWNKMTADIQSARDEMNSLNADIAGLTADKKLQEYWLSVAVAMGDTMRADQIRADMVKTDSDLAAKNKALAAAQAKTNKTLDGNSDAAIANRGEIRGLVTDYQSYIEALAASGVKGKALKDAVDSAKAKFYENGIALGYNKEQLDKYAIGFNDVTSAINTVPRNLTVDFNGSAILTAIAEWKVKLKEALQNAGSEGGGAMGDATAAALTRKLNAWAATYKPTAADKAASIDYTINYKADTHILQRINELNNAIGTLNRQQDRYGFSRARQDQIDKLLGQIAALGNYATGGYTGPGSKYQPAGIVHAGEYVVPREQVNQATGMPYFMSQPRSFAQGGFAGSTMSTGPMMVELSPYDRNLLAQAGNVQLRLDGRIVAQNTNANNTVAAQRGSN